MKKLVIFSVAGILLIFFLSNNIQYKEMDVLNKNDVGSNVCVNGYAKNVYNGEGYVLFNLLNNISNVKVVFFRDIFVNKSTDITVCGRVDFYKGEIEIKGHKLI
ncbi:MAG: hypothetical protein PHW96_01190 [Candidatus Nanoarchaeia archaeon]|nr:hypothetical protein [Candidatus Nanoarchaeia archaeon]